MSDRVHPKDQEQDQDQEQEVGSYEALRKKSS
jgi:hypothetical protein